MESLLLLSKSSNNNIRSLSNIFDHITNKDDDAGVVVVDDVDVDVDVEVFDNDVDTSVV